MKTPARHSKGVGQSHRAPGSFVSSKGVWVWLVVAVGILIALVMFSLHVGRLSSRAEPFTELYFTNPSTLPKDYESGQTQLVAFTVHNVEYRTEHYRYTITEGTNPGQPGELLESGAFSLHQGAYRHERAPVLLRPLGNRVNVTVTLTIQSTERQQSIAYWVTLGSP